MTGATSCTGGSSSSTSGGETTASVFALTPSSGPDGGGTEGIDEEATAAAAAAAYRIGGRAAAFGVGAEASALAGVEACGMGAGEILISIVLFRDICFFAETGDGGCSSEASLLDLLAGVDFFSFSSFAGVFGAMTAGADTGKGAGADTDAGAEMSSWISPTLAESRLDKSSVGPKSPTMSSSSCRLSSSYKPVS